MNIGVAIRQTWDLMMISNVLVKKSELKLDTKFYHISKWGNFSRGDTIDSKKKWMNNVIVEQVERVDSDQDIENQLVVRPT